MILLCPKCNTRLSVPDDSRAERVICAQCGHTFSCKEATAEEAARAKTAGTAIGQTAAKTAMGQVSIPGLRLTQFLGAGGMAEVFKGVQESLGREVAVKLLPEDLSQRPDFVARFEREAEALGRLNHPNIVSVLDRGRTPQGRHYILMEYVRGRTLAQLIQKKQLKPTRVVELMRDLCAGVSHAHSQGIIHRDLKPSNVIVQPDGRARVLDFGVARIVQGEGGVGPVTMTGVAVGTPAYMAPEQKLDAKRVDHRADIYALGGILYEMVTGKVPLGAYLPPSQAAPLFPFHFDEVVRKALAPEPSDRYATVAEFEKALLDAVAAAGEEALAKTILAPKPSRMSWRRRLVWAGGAAACILGAVALFSFLSGGEPSRTQAPKTIPSATTPQPTPPPQATKPEEPPQGPAAPVEEKPGPDSHGPETIPSVSTPEPTSPPQATKPEEAPQGPPAPPGQKPEPAKETATRPPEGGRTPLLTAAEIEKKLDQPISMVSPNLQVREALDFFQELLKVPVTVIGGDSSALERPVNMNVRDMPARSVLRLILQQGQMDCQVMDGGIVAGVPGSFPRRMETIAYEVGILLDAMRKRTPPQDEVDLMRAILAAADVTDARSLDGEAAGLTSPSGPVGKILVVGSRLMVTATAAAHQKVAGLLEQLTQDLATKVKLTLIFPKPIGQTLELEVLNGLSGQTMLAQQAPPAILQPAAPRTGIPVVSRATNSIRFQAKPIVSADRKSVRVDVSVQVAWVGATEMPTVTGPVTPGPSTRVVTPVTLFQTLQWVSENTVDIPDGKGVQLSPTTGTTGQFGPVILGARIIPPPKLAQSRPVSK